MKEKFIRQSLFSDTLNHYGMKTSFLRYGTWLYPVSLLSLIGILFFTGCKKDNFAQIDDTGGQSVGMLSDCELELTYEALTMRRVVPVGNITDTLPLAEQALAVPRFSKRRVEACFKPNGDFQATITMLPVEDPVPQNVLGAPNHADPDLQLQRIEIFNDEAAYYDGSGILFDGTPESGFNMAEAVRNELYYYKNFQPLSAEQVDAVIEGMKAGGLDITETASGRYVALREQLPIGGVRETLFDKYFQVDRGTAYYDEAGQLISRTGIFYEGTPDAPVLTGTQQLIYFDSPSTYNRMAIKMETQVSNYELLKN